MKHVLKSSRKYIQVFLMEWSEMKSFTLEFLMKLINYPLQVIIMFFIWSLIYTHSPQEQIESVPFTVVISYFVIQKMMAMAFTNTDVSLLVQQDITGESESTLIIFICRPLDYAWYLLSKVLAPTCLQLGLGIGLLVLVSLAFPHLSPIPIDLFQFVIFIILIAFALVIAFYIHLLIGYCTFWIGEAPRWYYYLLEAIIAGTLIPLSFFPPSVYQVLIMLPTAYIYYHPAALLVGLEPLTLPIIASFILWAVILIAISKFVWNLGLKRFDAQGG